MQNVSEAAKALVDSYQRVTLHLYAGGAAVEAGIGAATYSHACGSEEAFTFGNACAGRITMALASAMPELEGKPVQLTWDVDGTEYPLLQGRVKKATVSAGRTTIEAYDEMFFGGSKAFVAPEILKTACSVASAFHAVATQMGVEADPAIMEQLTAVTLPAGLSNLTGRESCSQVAGHIAGIFGMNALISRDGLLTMRGFPETGWSTEPYSGGAQAENREYIVSGVAFQKEILETSQASDGSSGESSSTVEFFAGDGTLAMLNPLADQEAADRAFEALEGVSLRPGSYSFPGGLLLEPGDLISIRSMDGEYQTAAVTVSMAFDGGVKTDISCGGANETGGAKGPLGQALETLQADIARVRKLIADNAEILSARITNLRAEDIVAGTIRSTDYKTAALEPVYPEETTFSSAALHPNNGEEITRGIEIDFKEGIIRGVFYNAAVDALSQRVDSLAERITALENSLVYPKAVTTSENSEEES